MSSSQDYKKENDICFLFFQNVGIYIEDIERYRTKSFHLIHLDDMFNDKCYRIIYKFNTGKFSII